MKAEIKEINREIFEWYISLEDKSDYAKPYLVTPEDGYCNAGNRGFILGKETAGWLEQVADPEIGQIEDEYDKVIEKSISMDGSAWWRMFFELRDRVNTESVKLTAGNVALLGYHYGKKGFPHKYMDKLAYFLKKYIEILKPGFIILFCGVGTRSGTDRPYISLLEMIFGAYLGSEVVEGAAEQNKWPLYRLKFKNIGTMRVYGTRHPERASNKWKEDIIDTINETIK